MSERLGVDVKEHLNALNVKLQGRKQLITEMRDSVKAFQMKLRLWEGQMHQGNLAHFPTCQSVSDSHHPIPDQSVC